MKRKRPTMATEKPKPKMTAELFVTNTVTYVSYAMIVLAMILMAPLIMCYGYYLFVSVQIKRMVEGHRKAKKEQAKGG